MYRFFVHLKSIVKVRIISQKVIFMCIFLFCSQRQKPIAIYYLPTLDLLMCLFLHLYKIKSERKSNLKVNKTLFRDFIKFLASSSPEICKPSLIIYTVMRQSVHEKNS